MVVRLADYHGFAAKAIWEMWGMWETITGGLAVMTFIGHITLRAIGN
jgi:hypothetical protein